MKSKSTAQTIQSRCVARNLQKRGQGYFGALGVEPTTLEKFVFVRKNNLILA